MPAWRSASSTPGVNSSVGPSSKVIATTGLGVNPRPMTLPNTRELGVNVPHVHAIRPSTITATSVFP